MMSCYAERQELTENASGILCYKACAKGGVINLPCVRIVVFHSCIN